MWHQQVIRDIKTNELLQPITQDIQVVRLRTIVTTVNWVKCKAVKDDDSELFVHIHVDRPDVRLPELQGHNDRRPRRPSPQR